MAMPLVVAEDDGSVPRDAVRRRSSPDIRKLTMPLDLICLGVEILIISMRHHHHGMGRRIHGIFGSGAARRQLLLRDQKKIFVFVLLVPARWPGPDGGEEVHNRIFVIHRTEFTTNCRLQHSSSEKDEEERNFTEEGKKSRAQKCQSSETFRGTGQLPS